MHTATSDTYTLPLPHALPISPPGVSTTLRDQVRSPTRIPSGPSARTSSRPAGWSGVNFIRLPYWMRAARVTAVDSPQEVSGCPDRGQ